jgi:uncharacterized protein (TIGR03790 family)
MAQLRRAVWLLTVLTLCGALRAAAQTGENVLVVANSSSPASLEIADYYAAKRKVPADQILRVTTPVAEEIARSTYDAQIERPIAQWLISHSAQDRILYIVVTKGVPLRVSGTSGTSGTVASVDSELTILYRKLSGQSISPASSISNPYFLGKSPVGSAKPFTRRQHDLYLVARLDGYTVADVKGLIDRGLAPSQQGRILLDARAELKSSTGNTWLADAATAVRKLPGWDARVVLDTSALPLRKQSDILGYYSWGSNDPLISLRRLDLKFVPGALAGMFVSSDARTMEEPPESWEVRGQDYAGSNQSLIGDLVRDGITGVAGHVAEPYLNATIRPDILFPAYLSGFNLVESFYLAMPALSWQTVVIGDPLCAPFRQQAIPATEIDEGIDRETEYPTFLSRRRLDLLTKSGLKLEAAKLALKSEVRLSKQDRTGARQALEKATELDDTFIAGHLTIANLYSIESQWAAANDRYRRVLAQQPNHPVALNNLAYSLAEHTKAPAEALPFAQRAYEVNKGSAIVADTLGWVYHLLNRDAEAEPLITAALQALPKNADVHLHAAAVFAAIGKADVAARELERALSLDKSLEQHDEVRQLRRRLEGPR